MKGDKIYFCVDQCHGMFQLSIDCEREKGGGYGFRLTGPKYDGTSKRIIRYSPDERAITELRAYLRIAAREIKRAKSSAAQTQGERG